MLKPLFRRATHRSFESRTVVASLYAALLGRHPAGGEEMPIVAHLDANGRIDQVVGWILGSTECQILHVNNPIFDDLTAPDPLPLDVPRLYLWHLPKTGGSSLREMLRPHFDEREFCGGVTMSQLYRMSHYRLRSFRVITGHFGPTLPRLLPEVPLVTVTLLRDPVELAVSHYVHWRDRGNAGDPVTELSRSLPFEQWCRSEQTRGLWSNPQANSLCSERIPPDRSQTKAAPEGAAIPVPADELLEKATALIDGIDIVGTTDRLLDTYRACLGRLGITPQQTEPLKENEGAGIQTPISQATRDWLLEHNSIDARLFEIATAAAPAEPGPA